MTKGKEGKAINVPLKLHNKAVITEDSAEITLYGDVVDQRPVDWWTGEPVPGHFISVDEVLEDLEAVKGKGSITFRLFSLGGDLYAGLAIKDRLQDLEATTTVIVDGIIASAATVIAMGADVIKSHPSDQIMMHEPSASLFGYYSLSDLKEVEKNLNVGIKSLIETYSSKTGIDQEKVKNAIMSTTWMTGREAYDRGYVDELIEGETVDMALAADASRITVNGFSQRLRDVRLPDGLPVRNDVAAKTFNRPSSKREQGGRKVYTTADEFRTECEDLYNQIVQDAMSMGKAQGIAEENARLKDIEAVQHTVNDKSMIYDAKFGETKCSAPELLYRDARANAAITTAYTQTRSAELVESGINEVTSAALPSTQVAPEKLEEAQAKQAGAEIAAYFTKGGPDDEGR